MISNERSSSFGLSPDGQSKLPVQEYILRSEMLQIEQWSYKLTLMENSRGRFLRITEKAGDGFGCIVVPFSGLEVFKGLLGDMIECGNKQSSAMVSRTKAQPPRGGGEHAAKSAMAQIERKNFIFSFAESVSGRLLRVTENIGIRCMDIFIPASGWKAFQRVLNEVSKPATKAPAEARPNEDIIKSAIVQVERTSFMLSLKETLHGRFLRITEKAPGRFNCVFVPAKGLEQFRQLMDEMVADSNQTPFPFNTAIPRPLSQEETLDAKQIQVYNKTFTFLLQENVRGRYLRLIEECPGYPANSFVIPSAGLEEFKKQVADMARTSNEHPHKELDKLRSDLVKPTGIFS